MGQLRSGWVLFKSRYLWIGSLIALIAGCVAIGLSGPSPQRVAFVDTIYLLDVAWRIVQGQVAHAQIDSPIGMATFLGLAQGMMWIGVDARTFPVTQIAFALLGWTAAMAVSRRRLSPYLSALFSVWIGYMLLSQRPLTTAYWQTSYAAYYNRVAWALYLILSLFAIVPSKGTGARSERGFFYGAVIGSGAMLLFLIKINAIVAFLPVIVLFFWLDASKARLSGLLTGVVAIALLAKISIGVGMGDYALDLQQMAHIQGDVSRLGQIVQLLGTQWMSLSVLGTAAVFAWSGRWLALLPLVPGFLISLGNSQSGETQSIALCAFLGTALLGERSIRRRILGGWLATLLVLSTFLSDVASTVIVAYKSLALDPSIERIDPFPPFVGEEGKAYAIQIRDGMTLLNRFDPDRRWCVHTLDAANPFPFGRRAPSPKRGFSFWHPGKLVDEAWAPSFEVLFSSVDAVMDPRFPQSKSAHTFFLSLYGFRIGKDFEKIGESPAWTLYRRRIHSQESFSGVK